MGAIGARLNFHSPPRCSGNRPSRCPKHRYRQRKASQQPAGAIIKGLPASDLVVAEVQERVSSGQQSAKMLLPLPKRQRAKGFAIGPGPGNRSTAPDGSLCIQHVVYVPIGPATSFVGPGLRAAISVQELQEWLDRRSA